MTFLQKLRKSILANPKRFIVLTAVLGSFLCYAALNGVAQREANLRKSPEALVFEKTPDDWLAHPTNEAQFRKALESRALAAVALTPNAPSLVLYTLKDGKKASAVVPGCTAMGCAGTVLENLGEKSAKAGFTLVRVDVDPRTDSRKVLDFLGVLLAPLTLVITMVSAIFMATKLQTGMGNSAAKLTERPEKTFDDVIGNDEAKAALNRVKAFMHDPVHYVKLGASAPRGVLLVGPPGTGKTLLAKALAGESKASFIAVDGSYFTSMFYGAGVAKVKDLFALARKNAPCVLFIDEVDGIGRRSHGSETRGAESESNRIINRVLVEMDGFGALDNVVVVAATNHEQNIDDAMRRPGRFDMLVRMKLPTLPERAKLFALYIGKVVSDGSADMGALARMTSGVSPADVANIVNKAASTAAESRAVAVTGEHFMQAIETHQLGGEVSGLKDLLTESTRTRLAFHEAGHALAGHLLKVGVVERVTIEPRGQALGVTYITRDTEDPLFKQGELTNRLAMMLAGREAELLVFGDVSTGASDDLKRASELAINMVGSLGFSKAFGLLSVAGVPKELLGPDIQGAVLKEARAMLEQSQATCQQLLETNRLQLNALAQSLLERDVVSGDELNRLLGRTSAACDEMAVLSPPEGKRRIAMA